MLVVDVKVLPLVVVVVRAEVVVMEVVEYGQALQDLQNHCPHASAQPPSKVLQMARLQSADLDVDVDVITVVVLDVSGVVVGPVVPLVVVVVGPEVVVMLVVITVCVLVAVVVKGQRLQDLQNH
mmetsp:Transcript_153653/g.286416  ORF Transcript_153653/g.286416 Transcript_153653/m.286416 type:complete len:124 (+) Transcript_153653:88-459(+)